MVRDEPLHNFLFKTDPTGFYKNLDCFCTPWIDVCVILHLIRLYRPRTFLEVGTHWGVTTRLIAERFPDMSIVTVDPGDRIPEAERPSNQTAEFLPQDEIGKLVRNFRNVEIIKQPFSRIAWGDQKFEMIFIDGNHSLPFVLEDSHLALQLITHPGVILWHDFNNVPDVRRALDQLELPLPLISLHNTWIAYYDTHEVRV